MQTTLDVFPQGRALRMAADRQLMTALFNQMKSARTTVKVPAQSSLGCWLQVYRKALNRPNLWAKVTRLPLGLADLAAQYDGLDLELPAARVLQFYGYPSPWHRGQLMVISEALDQPGNKPGLDERLKLRDQDLHQIADTLENLIDDDFNLYACYKTYLKLDSGSFWATAQQTGAAFLDAITTKAGFLALDTVQGLQPGAYAFNAATRQLSGKTARGTLAHIGIEDLLALPLDGELEKLIEVAEQLGTLVHQSGLFSLAELLRCHDLEVPDTPEEARAQVAALRQSTPLNLVPVSDLAHSDLALMQHQQWLALDHDRDVMAEALKTLIRDTPGDSLIDTAHVSVVPAPPASHPAMSDNPTCGPFNLKQLLQQHALVIPGTVDDAQGILHTLEMNLPRSPEYGDYHALLSATAQTPVQLDAAQRQTIIETAHGTSRLLDRLCGTLLVGKHADEIRAQADGLLKQLLDLEPARALAHQLVTALRWYGQHTDEYPSQTSLDLLVVSALILDLDASLAGFDLTAGTHTGKTCAELRSDLELHLVRRCKVSTLAAPLAAHLLLAGAAPECLVQALPATLRFRTSIAWMSFKQGVMMAEALAPGSARYMTYDDMISLASQPSTTSQQQQWREYTATRVLLDWAIAVGELPERENGHYTGGEIDALKQRLTQRLQALKDALVTFASEPPTRNSIALADLKSVFPQHPLLEKACLWRPVPPIASSSLRFPMHHHDRQNYSLHSLVELHIDSLLGDTRWQSTELQLDLAQMRPLFGRLSNINERFDSAFGAHIERMKQAYRTAIEDLLAQLPAADRLHIQQADLQLLVLKREPGKDLALLSPAEEIARTARMGVILRATSPIAVHEYELFPLLNRVDKRSGPPLMFREGGTPMSVITGGPHSTKPVTQLLIGDELPVDWDAYASGRPPRPQARAKVIVHVLWSSSPATLTFGSPVARAIAQAIVRRHFFLDVDALRQQARGTTQREQAQHTWDRLMARLKALIPFWSCTEDIASGDTRRIIDGAYGCFIDLLLVLFPAKQFAGASLAILKRTAPLPIKLLQLGRLGGTFLNTVLNPIDGIPGLFRLARSGLIRLSASARQVLDTAIRQVQRRSATLPLLDYPRLLARADIGAGTVLRGSDYVRINAVLHKHQWHTCDPFSARPYGPPLNTFRLDSALSVTPMQAANGYQALVTERLFATPPLTLPRSGATDLLDHNSLLRLEHPAPTHFDDLTSPAYFKTAEGFDTLCGPARTKRSPIPLICFTKKLAAFNASIHQRRVQAIEHIRLIPAPAIGSDTRKVVHNRRLYEATPQGTTFELTPVAMHSPLVYKPQINGKFIHEPQFGLPNDQLDNILSRDTRVVELEGLTNEVDDRRTLRAMAITLTPSDTRVIVEADAGVFYEAAPTATAPLLRFIQLDFSSGGPHEQLIRAFGQHKLDYLTAGGFTHSRPLINLPTLEVLYRQLAQRGFNQQKLARLQAQASALTPLKQRELLLNASDQGQRLGMSVAVAPLQLDTWPPYRAGSANAQSINQYLATQAHASTVALVQNTGIGSANVVGTGIRELDRLSIAEPLVMWQYSRVGQPNYTEVILKTGAGNCDQMAHVASELIKVNGGVAQVWGTSPPAHAFVVVGIQPPTLAPTLEFREAGWAGLWICDPWAGIACPAGDYMRKLNEKMIVWHLQDVSVFFNDGGTYRWAQANDRNWLKALKDGVKRPQF